MKIYPSLISSDILNLREVIRILDSHCDGYHVDVMDDHFVPNLTWGPSFISAIREETQLPIHLHLMVDNPEKWIDRVNLKKDDLFIFHCEVMERIVKEIPKLTCRVGIALNPKTPVTEIESLIGILDHVLVMSVEPGFSGQKFIPEVIKKVSDLILIRKKNNLSFSIGMDGGVSEKNIAILAKEGVDEVGVASAIFSRKDYVDSLKNLYKLGMS